MEWIFNKSPSCAAYRSFMSGFMIALDKLPGIHPLGVGETWQFFFAKCVLKVTGPEDNHA